MGLAKEIEIEELIPCPHVIKRVQMYKLKYYMANALRRVPSEQV
jgi:hypothetical protein